MPDAVTAWLLTGSEPHWSSVHLCVDDLPIAEREHNGPEDDLVSEELAEFDAGGGRVASNRRGVCAA